MATHHELIASPESALDLIPRLPEVYDEPFADYSQLPTMLVSHWARRHVTVCLSGDGGDELFGGYNRHVWASRAAVVPWLLRRIGARALGLLTPVQWDRATHILSPLLPRRMRLRLVGDKSQKLRAALLATDAQSAYRRLVALGVDLGGTGAAANAGYFDHWSDLSSGLDDASRMMAIDTLTYLPDDILCKVDRASMAFSLETRAPFLDHRIVEFAWRLPTVWKACPGQSKRILREVLARRVPRHLWERPKAGFGIPLGEWLRGPLRDWAEDLISERSLRAHDLLDEPTVRRIWSEHLSLRRDWTRELWTALMLQQWARRWL